MAVQFLDFYRSLDPDPIKRGKQFEYFVRWFLKTDPEWATQVDQVWLWDEWPQRWGADCGVDLVFRHKNGEHWAVQAKCYAPDYDITKHDVDKFLSESNRPLIQHRLLIATTDRIGANARQVCDAQDKPVIRFLLSDFEKSALDYPANLSELPQAKRKPRPEPKEHQLEAIEAVVEGLKTADRGQLIMACGTGKTYTTLWIKEILGSNRTLVLLPSLGLLSQTLREWTFAAATPFEVLCVCSDQTVGSKGNDEAIHSVADLAFPVTSDTEDVKRFLSGAGNRVVFSTYQSSLVVAAAQADPAIPAFDLAVADEAHRCAGKVGSDFTAILDNSQIRSAKRLFATATPRTYSSNIKKASEERGVEVVGMDDAEKFGEVLYALPFGKAIARKLLTDYRVVIIGVDDPTIAQWIARRELVSTGTGIETDSESLAAQIGLLKAIKDYDLKRIISFHSRVKRAEDFTTDMQNTMQWINDEHRPSGTLRTDFVSGNMPANKRKIKLDQLKALSADERGVLSNARCLSEGVDVPSLDGVAFIDPRSSQVDIIQAVGRAIRLSPDKKAGTIVLPAFIKAGEDAASTIEASNFKPIWEVLDALKAHDDVLACELDQIRTERGRKPGSSVGEDALRKITFDLPATIDANFGSALRTCLVEQVTESWDGRYGQLLAYKAEHRDVNVPRYHSSGLGTWVHHQRHNAKKGSVSKVRIQRLDEIGFDWNPVESQWMVQFEKLAKYKAKHGHLNLPDRSSSKLGVWMSSQRANRRNGILTTERVRFLDEIGFEWVPFGSAWNEGFNKLIEYKAKYGSVDVPKKPITDLGTWVGVQRRARNKGEISEDRIRLLDEIGFVWDARDFRWEAMFKELSAYKEVHGHLNMPTTSTGLGSWVHIQRRAKRHGKLPEEKIRRLDEIGFSWAFIDSRWEEKYSELVSYKAKHGNLCVPAALNGLRQWLSVQRRNKRSGTLSTERIALLDRLGFEWRPPMSPPPRKNTDADWLARHKELYEYKEKHGHTNVPQHLATGLGNWVGTQRQARKNGKISDDRIQMLDKIGFEWERKVKV
jgi:superfamily II DNA or RNA helicase